MLTTTVESLEYKLSITRLRLGASEGKDYEMSVVMQKPWRALVTLSEFEQRKRKWVATERKWVEPFDPVRGEPEELGTRFLRQIAAGTSAGDDPGDVIRDKLIGKFGLEPFQTPLRFWQIIKKLKKGKNNISG